jgi:hypothetical protein
MRLLSRVKTSDNQVTELLKEGIHALVDDLLMSVINKSLDKFL